MDRRAFFGLFGGVATLGLSRVSAAPIACDWPIPYSVDESRYSYGWTGLKGTVENASLVGQWVAAPHDSTMPYLYVNVPGFTGGPYQPGSTFSLNPRGRWILPVTPPEQIHRWIEEGRGYLFALIDAYQNVAYRDLKGWPIYHFPEDYAAL
jgi:hypothetical protein